MSKKTIGKTIIWVFLLLLSWLLMRYWNSITNELVKTKLFEGQKILDRQQSLKMMVFSTFLIILILISLIFSFQKETPLYLKILFWVLLLFWGIYMYINTWGLGFAA